MFYKKIINHCEKLLYLLKLKSISEKGIYCKLQIKTCLSLQWVNSKVHVSKHA